MAGTKRPLGDRFWEKVNKTEHCWLWNAGVDKDGYGQLWVDQNMRRARAPRVAWFLYYGKWPEAFVLHSCDTPSCVRKEHLFEGNNLLNAQDRARKGRSARNINPQKGEKNGNAVLTTSNLQRIRQLYVPGQVKQKDLAEQFSVSQVRISQITRGLGWAGSLSV